MCGIAGLVDITGEPVDRAVLGAMNDAIAHRGPDDDGLWFGPGVGLAHRRLAIVDLSSAGHNPMPNQDRTSWITYNGEVYNAAGIRPDLESAGHQFRSRTDTEVVLHAYERWGPESVHRFIGMFAYAIWDGRNDELFVVRDRFGIKPLYYHWDGRRLAFASEIKALLTVPWVDTEPNAEVAYRYLAHGLIDDSDETFFTGIRRLPAGHYLTASKAGMEIKQYYRIDPEAKIRPPSEAAAVSDFRELLEDAVALRLVSDVPVATNLSGGLDSSMVASLAVARLRGSADGLGDPGGLPHKTFSAVFPGSPLDERPFVDMVVDQLPLDPQFVTPTFQNLMDQIEAQTRRQDQPVMSAAMIAKGEVMRLVQQHGIKVVLEGQGADEYLCGYTDAAPWGIADKMRGGRLLSAMQDLKAFTDLLGLPLGAEGRDALGKAFPSLLEMRNGLRGLLGRSTVAPSKPEWLGKDFRDAVTERDPHRYADGLLDDYSLRGLHEFALPFYLRADDHNAMAFSVEARLPLLDHRLVEMAIALPGDFRTHRGVSKWIAREAVRGIVPEDIRTFNGKRAFPTPMAEWFRGPSREAMEEMTSSETLRARDVFDADGMRAMVSDFLAGNDQHVHTIWRVLNYEIWLRSHGF